MRRRIAAGMLGWAVIGFSGCAHVPSPTVESQPAAKAAIQPANIAASAAPAASTPEIAPIEKPAAAAPATIIGSEETSTLLDNFTAYIAAVDDREIPAGRGGWAERITLSPGPHRLVVGFVRGVFTATANLEFTARAGTSYELQHQSDAQIYGDHSYCEFWVVNKNTGEKTTGVVRVSIARLKN